MAGWHEFCNSLLQDTFTRVLPVPVRDRKVAHSMRTRSLVRALGALLALLVGMGTVGVGLFRKRRK